MKKNQHFVPQFLLKNFSDNGKQIGIYNVSDRKYITRGSLKKQAYKSYFYGKDDIIENFFGQLESATAPIIKEIAQKKILPDKKSEEYLLLIFFISTLYVRTYKKFLNMQSMMDKLLKDIASEINPELIQHFDAVNFRFNRYPPFLIKIAMEDLPKCILDLDYKLICIKSPDINKTFLISDHPVVLYNQFLRNIKILNGFALKGIQIFMPLSYDSLLIFYDKERYKVGYRNKDLIKITQKDVKLLNKLQYISCDKNLYFYPELITEDYFKLINVKKDHDAVIIEKFKNQDSTLFALQEYSETNFHLTFSFIGFTKKAKKEKKELIKKIKKGEPIPYIDLMRILY